MEVKNPLFLDDPTPVKKSAPAKPQTSQQSQQQKQQAKPQQPNDNPKTLDPAIKK